MKNIIHHYFAIYKPYGYLSQFTPEHDGQLTLADLYSFPPDVYPVGRLDKDSEGLLLLSNDKSLTATLLHPDHKCSKIYWAQVEGIPTAESLEPLKTGVTLRIKKKTHKTKPAGYRILNEVDVPDRQPPIRHRKNIPTAWVELSIYEGKYHQIRKMMAHVGFPVLRLIRVAVGSYHLDHLEVGEVRTVSLDQIL